MLRFFEQYKCLSLPILLCYICFCLPIKSYSANNYAQNSVLAKGKWFRIAITKGTGMYKLTYDDLIKIGLSNPADVKVHGYGGWILDEDFSKSTYIDDLPQVSIWMSNDRASFGKGDYILFYARDNIKWSFDTNKQEFTHTQNPYSEASYYFITESSEEPMFAQKSHYSNENIGTPITDFDDYYLHEKELVNVAKTGRSYYGEYFGTNKSQNFDVALEGVTGDKATICYDFISRSTLSSCMLTVSLNGQNIEDPNPLPLIGSNENYYYTHGKPINRLVKLSNLQEKNTVNFTVDVGNSRVSNLYLNYFRINYKRKLQPYGAVTLFRSKVLDQNVNFQISNASNSNIILDVTDNTNVKIVDAQLSGTTLSFSASNTTIREYAIVDLSKEIPTPDINNKSVIKVENQDLHGSEGADMIIIVQPKLRQYAERLAGLHKDYSGLTSLVVDPQKIYNEFSSGKPDITAYRLFIKLLYDKATLGGVRPKYLLLFGGGTYNNRLIGMENTAEAETMLLTYQSEESLLETSSYVTDDYLGFLEDSEGSNWATATLDIAIGRLPVKTENQAENVVNKIEAYMRDASKGIWQNNITFAADDLFGNTSIDIERKHVDNSEYLASFVETNYPPFIIDKIYEDAYERVIEANGARYPDATKALLDRIEKGTLVLNFIGHGSTRNWTHENLLTYSDIENLGNDKLALWITATCDFSRFDADQQSAGELAILKPKGGAIALFSTSRVVYIQDNEDMSKNIIKNLFEKSDGETASLGDILKDAKLNMLKNSNKLRFMLLGDPALKLAYPGDRYKVEVTEMNGEEVSAGPVNIKALDNVVIKGRIADYDGVTATTFNGILESVVFDAFQNLKTRGNTASGATDESLATPYTDYTNTLFSGRVEIKNGLFEILFTTPKDITYTGNKGKISFFAYDNDGKNKAQGHYDNYTVGGTNTDVDEDLNPPIIEQMMLNGMKLTSDKIHHVNPTPKFYAEISDDVGINLSSGLGHNIALIIDGGKVEYDLTPYFVNTEGSSKKGSVTYILPQLSLGNHYLEFRIWDVSNNSTISEAIEFIVTDDYETSSYSFDIWGNPARDLTKFVFTTDIPATDVSIKLSVHSLTGKMVWTYEERGSVDSLNQYIYNWDLSRNGGGRIDAGVYICTGQITVNGKSTAVKSKKLMVVN